MATRTITAAGGNYSSTSTWVEGAVPTAADDVVALAGGLSGQLTIDVNSSARSIDFTNYTNTVTHISGVTLTLGTSTTNGSLSLKMVAGMIYTLGSVTSSAITFISTSGTQEQITTAGKTFGNITFNGSAGSWQLQDAITIGATATTTLTAGTLDTNGKACSWGLFALGVGTKTLTLGASIITLTGTGTSWNALTNGANFTINAGTSAIQTVINTTTFAGNGKTYYNLTFTGSGNNIISGANTFNNVTITPPAGTNAGLVFQADMVIGGTFTATGLNSATNAGRIVVSPAVTTFIGTARILTITAVSLTNVDFNFINAAGTAIPFTGVSIGDGCGNSNITFDAPRNLYWVGAAGNWGTLNRWSLSSGGAIANTAPLPQDNCNIDANSGVGASQTFSSSLRYLGRNIDFTGVTNSPTFDLNGFNPDITGNLTWAVGMTLINNGSSATLNLPFDTRAVTLTNNGVIYPVGFSLNIGGTGSFTLADDLTMNAAQVLTITGGTFNANNKNISVGQVSSSSSNTRTINMGSGTWTVTGNGSIWAFSNTTGLTLNSSTSILIFNDTTSNSKTISGAGLVYSSLQVAGGGTGLFIFGNSMAIANLTLGAPKSVQFLAGGTITITNSFTAIGSSGNLITITSSTAGTAANLTKSSAGAVSANWLSLKDSHAQGTAPWYAANSTNVSGNTGWVFTNNLPIYCTESTTTSDSVAASNPILPATVSDTLTTTESTQRNLTIGLSVDPSQPAYTVPGVKIV